jgi:hypothetical protein
MLKQRVLTDNMAPQRFFSQLTRKPVAKKFWEVSPYYASDMATACRENPDICARICLVTPYLYLTEIMVFSTEYSPKESQAFGAIL